LKNLLRRIRGAIGMGLTWSIPWAAVSAVTRAAIIYFLVPLPADLSRLNVVLQAAITNGISGALIGFLTGTAFSLVLTMAERNRTLSSLSARRFALWGAAAGGVTATTLVTLTWSGGVPNLVFASSFITVSVALGAACAALTLRLARIRD
jgi:hypothetical protein